MQFEPVVNLRPSPKHLKVLFGKVVSQRRGENLAGGLADEVALGLLVTTPHQRVVDRDIPALIVLDEIDGIGNAIEDFFPVCGTGETLKKLMLELDGIQGRRRETI